MNRVDHVRLPGILMSFSRVFHSAGFECYLVGGAVRNMLSKKPTGDFDVATDAKPDDVNALFDRVFPTGIRHGTVTVRYKGSEFEVTTFRSERGYSDRRHPDAVTFVGTINEDLRRRDFTINSIAIDCRNGAVVDPNEGREDLRNRILRAIGNPNTRFREDGLRLIRACRFVAQLDLTVEPETLIGMRENAPALEGVSAERVFDELRKILDCPQPSTAFRVFAETHLLSQIIPELDACREIEQKGLHRFDVFDHSIYAYDAAPASDPAVRMAALLHDIGKPEAKRVAEDGTVTFHRHEEISEKLAHTILQRLKSPRLFELRVCHLIRHHMFHYEPNWSDSAVRRFVKRIGIENTEQLFALRRADSRAITGKSEPGNNLDELTKRIVQVKASRDAISVRDLAINGNELADLAGIPKTETMGTVLEFLLESVLDDPTLNEKERLLELGASFYKRRIDIG